MYYSLHHHCRIVRGACRAAIYDFKSGKVWSINHSAFTLLTNSCISPIEEYTHPDQDKKDFELAFLRNLTEKKLGEFRDSPGPYETPMTDPKVRLEFLWLELTSAGNNRCLHCYSESTSTSFPSKPVLLERWKTVIGEVRLEGAEAIQLIGGEPLLYPHWQDLVLTAKNFGYSLIEIFTNATLIDDGCIKFFQECKVNIATTIYADNEEIHNRITQNPTSFKKTLTAIEKLQEAGIPLRIASIVMKQNEEAVPGILSLYKKWNMDGAFPDIIRPTGRGNDEELLPTQYQRPEITPPFYTDEYSFALGQHYNSCLAGKLAITSSGDVIPCIFARSQICGNILSTPLSEIITKSPLTNCWETTKNQIKKCKDCEYRFACSDCRPLAQSMSPNNDWFSEPKNCHYDPYTGKWKTPKEKEDI